MNVYLWALCALLITTTSCTSQGRQIATVELHAKEYQVFVQQVSSDPEPVTPEPAPVDKPDPRIELVYRYLSPGPLADYAGVLVDAADQFQLDWRLLPALSMQESSGGTMACGYNPFGWDSCGVTFDSWEQSISYVGDSLSNGRYYRGKSLEDKLCTYQSGHGCYGRAAEYAREVMSKMEDVSGLP